MDEKKWNSSCAFVFSDEAHCQFKIGWPEEPSQVFDLHRQYYSIAAEVRDKQLQPHFLYYNEMDVELWGLPQSILFEARVKSGISHLFGDGAQAFPEEELQNAGLGHLIVELAQDARFAEVVVDRSAEYVRYTDQKVPDSYLVTVTWKESFSWYLGELAQQFLSLRKYGSDEVLRVVAVLG